MTTPQRWRIAVKDPEWRWVPSLDDKAVPYEWKLHDSAEHDLRNFCEHYKIPSVVVAGPPFTLPGTEPQAVQPKPTPSEIVASTIALSNAGSSNLRPAPQPVDIDALQKLYDASTPGEWSAHEEPPGCSVAAWLERNNDELASFQVDGDIHDARFCAASHNATPQLLAEVRELRKSVAVRDYQIAKIKTQLPEEMKECTIEFVECPKGHGRLISTNWVDNDCPYCELAASQEREKRLREALSGLMCWVGTLPEGPDWATPEAKAKNREMYENAIAAANACFDEHDAALAKE